MDVIRVDVPTFIRLLEYSKEDAKTDMDLHKVTEKCLKQLQKKHVLTMDDYSKLIPRRKRKL